MNQPQNKATPDGSLHEKATYIPTPLEEIKDIVNYIERIYHLKLQTIAREIGVTRKWLQKVLDGYIETIPEDLLDKIDSVIDNRDSGGKGAAIPLNRENFAQFISFLIQTYPFVTEEEIEDYLCKKESFVQDCRNGKIVSIPISTIGLLAYLYNDLKSDPRNSLAEIKDPTKMITLLVEMVEPQYQLELKQILLNIFDANTQTFNIPKEGKVKIADLYKYLKNKLGEEPGFINFELLSAYLNGKLTDPEEPISDFNTPADAAEGIYRSPYGSKGGKLPSLDWYDMKS